jgi:Arm DNA-binding domain
MKRRITNAFVNSIRAAPGKRFEVTDTIAQGLVLRVSPTGSLAWSVHFRTSDGRRPRINLGRYPAVGLRAARKLALAAQGARFAGEAAARIASLLPAERQAVRRRSPPASSVTGD